MELNLELNAQWCESDDSSGNPVLSECQQAQQQQQQECIRNPVFLMAGGGRRGNSKEAEPHIGMEFHSLGLAKQFYMQYAECLGFRARSNRIRISKRDQSIIAQQFVCYKEKKVKRSIYGRPRKKRNSFNEGCKAMFEVVRREPDRWVVVKLITEHPHPFAPSLKPRKPWTKRTINMRSLFGDGPGDEIKHDAIWGREKAYGLLEYLDLMQSENPAFFYSVQVNENNTVTNVFWADAKARMAYSYFGDIVSLDTTYKKNKNMMPFVPFTGVNHHLQSVVFGCTVLLDETESSFVWLFETFLVAMCGRCPVSLVTDQNEALEAAVARVFPETRHRFCKWGILSKCKEKLQGVCLDQTTRCSFKRALKKCIDDSETVEDFELGWEAIIAKYNLWENTWLQSLYQVRQQWATVYLKDKFFAEMSPAQRAESMNKFFNRNFESKSSLREFIKNFDQAMMGQHEKEVQADFADMYTEPVLRTTSPIENQAAKKYTKTIFTIFQEEFIQSCGCSFSTDKFVDGAVCLYRVTFKGEGVHRMHTVAFDTSKRRASCSCHKFEFAGILCRHVLGVFSLLGFCDLPEEYFLKRWMQNAKCGAALYELSTELQSGHQNALTLRCNDLCLDVLEYAAGGATSSVIYKVAKEALRKAFAEVVTAKKSLNLTGQGK